MVPTSKPALNFHVSLRTSSIHLPMVPTAEFHLSTFLNPDNFAVCLTKSDLLERCSKNWLGIHSIPRVLGREGRRRRVPILDPTLISAARCLARELRSGSRSECTILVRRAGRDEIRGT